jgi:hypothetical protein
MTDKKDLIIAVLATFSLTVTLFAVIPIRSSGPYDAWIDYNDDGKISLEDITATLDSFGSTGDPTKNVNVTNLPWIQPEPKLVWCGDWVITPTNLDNITSLPYVDTNGYSRIRIFIKYYAIDPPPGSQYQYIYLTSFIWWFSAPSAWNFLEEDAPTTVCQVCGYGALTLSTNSYTVKAPYAVFRAGMVQPLEPYAFNGTFSIYAYLSHGGEEDSAPEPVQYMESVHSMTGTNHLLGLYPTLGFSQVTIEFYSNVTWGTVYVDFDIGVSGVRDTFSATRELIKTYTLNGTRSLSLWFWSPSSEPYDIMTDVICFN